MSQGMGKYSGFLFADVKIARDTSSENDFEHAPTVLHVKIESVNICLLFFLTGVTHFLKYQLCSK